MVSSFDVVEKIRSYLSGKENLDSFREWILVSRVSGADENAKALLAAIEGRSFEYAENLVPEKQWRGRLAALIAPQPRTANGYVLAASAESSLLTYFYSTPSGVHGGAESKSLAPSEVSNFNGLVNYREVPEECVTA